MDDFAAQYKRPEWQRKRLEVMQAAGFKCEECFAADKTLNVHHKLYHRGRMVWDYAPDELRCLCEGCHEKFHAIKQELLMLLDTGCCMSEWVLGFARAASFYADEQPIPINTRSEAFGAALFFSGIQQLYRHEESDVADALVKMAMRSPTRSVDPEMVDLLFGERPTGGQG